MNEPRTVALTLWSRLTSGESLDEVDQKRLAGLLQQDTLLRKEIEADATLNALLRFMTDVRQTDDQFVQDVLDRCSAMSACTPPNVDVNQIERQLGGFSDEIDPLKGVLESANFNGAEITVATNHISKHDRAFASRRQRSTWTAFALTTVIFACLGLIGWSLLDAPIPTARTNPPNNVLQEPDSAAASNPQNESTHSPHAVTSGENASNPKSKSIDRPNESLPVEIPPLNLPSQNERFAQRSNAKSLSPFVTLTKIDDPVWERKNVLGERLGDEIVRLFAGSVELTFDEGAVVTVNGPIEFRPLSTGQLELRRGRLFASVPQKAIGFTVSTPTSKIVDLGTEFEVAVNDAGESDVQVLKGEIEVAPVTADEDGAQKWRLLPDEFNRASFFALPQIQGPVPVSTSLQGQGGRFQGFVSLNGKTAEFTSQEAFDNVRRRAVTELVRSQENALMEWKEFVDSMQRNMQGTMKLNGQEMRFGSLQDVMRLQNRMLERVQKAGNDSNESSFAGSIKINGKLMTFKSREEYDAARRAAFGPAATFGIGEILGIDPANR